MLTQSAFKWPVICLMGATGSNKSVSALELAEYFPVKIVSVDSQAVYRGMDIGTAKPKPAILRSMPHELIDICDPKESYSAGQFYQDALNAIHTIHMQNAVPLLVGGTMLYFRVLQQGIAHLPARDPLLRSQLQTQMREQGGVLTLYAQLMEIDPLAAKRIHPHDHQRILRALEVYWLTHKTLSHWHAEQKQASIEHLKSYSLYYIGILPTCRIRLYENVETRFDQMLVQGLVEEVEHLYRRGDLTSQFPAIHGVGYKQVWEYLAARYRYSDMRQRAISATRQLIKRQLTWLRHWPVTMTCFESEPAQTLGMRLRIHIKKILCIHGL